MDISNLSIATIRSLGIDTINKANSGHPGMVLGSAPALYTLFNKELNIDAFFILCPYIMVFVLLGVRIKGVPDFESSL